MKKENICLIIEEGWFGRKYKFYNHEWGYKNTHERECIKCGRKELFFGEFYSNGSYHEDWRRKI